MNNNKTLYNLMNNLTLMNNNKTLYNDLLLFV